MIRQATVAEIQYLGCVVSLFRLAEVQSDEQRSDRPQR